MLDSGLGDAVRHGVDRIHKAPGVVLAARGGEEAAEPAQLYVVELEFVQQLLARTQVALGTQDARVWVVPHRVVVLGCRDLLGDGYQLRGWGGG